MEDWEWKNGRLEDWVKFLPPILPLFHPSSLFPSSLFRFALIPARQDSARLQYSQSRFQPHLHRRVVHLGVRRQKVYLLR